ncbi:MAG: hypothetical protein ACFB15_22360 [Cyclobacteriaceae bacterium]
MAITSTNLLFFQLVIGSVNAVSAESLVDSTLSEILIDSGYVEVDGSKLRYVVEGKGIPCLVIGFRYTILAHFLRS